MTFTDEDFKRLKEDLYEFQMFKPEHMGQRRHDLKALITRLDDSEERLRAVASVLHLLHARYKNDLRQNERTALEAGISLIKEWREAAGK